MKLNYTQLEPHLRTTLAPVYVISGEEPFLKQDALRQIRAAAKIAGYQESVRLDLSATTAATELANALYGQSFFTSTCIVEVDLQHTLPNKACTQLLIDYVREAKPPHLLLLVLGKVDAKLSKATWFQAVTAKGHHITIWPLLDHQLPAWLIHRARLYKMVLSPEAAALLSESVVGNLTAAAQMIEKLYLMRVSTTITPEIIAQLISDDSRFSIFDLMDTILAQDSKRLLQIIAYLQAEGIEPTLVLWGLTRELRLLIELKSAMLQSLNIEQWWQKNRVFPRHQAAMRRFAQNTPHEQCLALLSQAAKLDNLIKGAVPGNVWQAFTLFCLQMTG